MQNINLNVVFRRSSFADLKILECYYFNITKIIPIDKDIKSLIFKKYESSEIEKETYTSIYYNYKKKEYLDLVSRLLLDKKIEYQLSKRIRNILAFIIDYNFLFNNFYNQKLSKLNYLIEVFFKFNQIIMNLDKSGLDFFFQKDINDFQVF